jgi:hypothetical protein
VSLERTLHWDFYLSPELFGREKEQIFCREWLCVGREEEIAQPGSMCCRTWRGRACWWLVPRRAGWQHTITSAGIVAPSSCRLPGEISAAPSGVPTILGPTPSTANSVPLRFSTRAMASLEAIGRSRRRIYPLAPRVSPAPGSPASSCFIPPRCPAAYSIVRRRRVLGPDEPPRTGPSASRSSAE